MLKKHPVLTVLLALLVLILLAFGITGGIIMNAAREGTGQFDYLLVLGTTVEGTEPSALLADRIHAAYDYLAANEDVICIVSGGKGSEENLSEAQCMYNKLTEMGIAPERILLEDRATSTVENFEFSLALIRAQTGAAPEALGVLSSDFHLFRANMFARQQGIEMVPIPAKTTDAGAFIGWFLREIIMVWYYSLLG